MQYTRLKLHEPLVFPPNKYVDGHPIIGCVALSFIRYSFRCPEQKKPCNETIFWATLLINFIDKILQQKELSLT